VHEKSGTESLAARNPFARRITAALEFVDDLHNLKQPRCGIRVARLKWWLAREAFIELTVRQLNSFFRQRLRGSDGGGMVAHQLIERREAIRQGVTLKSDEFD